MKVNFQCIALNQRLTGYHINKTMVLKCQNCVFNNSETCNFQKLFENSSVQMATNIPPAKIIVILFAIEYSLILNTIFLHLLNIEFQDLLKMNTYNSQIYLN